MALQSTLRDQERVSVSCRQDAIWYVQRFHVFGIKALSLTAMFLSSLSMHL